jgi:hypothetical protein
VRGENVKGRDHAVSLVAVIVLQEDVDPDPGNKNIFLLFVLIEYLIKDSGRRAVDSSTELCPIFVWNACSVKCNC